MDPFNALTIAGAKELEKARSLEEGFEVNEAPEGEEAQKDETTAPEITADMWARAQDTIRTLTTRATLAEGLVRRYIAKYGELED